MSSDELEADDLLGALATAEEEAGGRAMIMTGDRDMYQCATERISVVYLKQRSSGFEEVDPEEVQRRYGIPPALVPDFIALRGDSSDGLPGAPGIGEKTAADLLQRHGSLDGAIAAADQERPRVAAALTDAADELRAFRAIATLHRADVELPPDRATDLDGGARPRAGTGDEPARRAARGRRVAQRPLKQAHRGRLLARVAAGQRRLSRCLLRS